MKPGQVPRKTARTVLLAGEGDSEVLFMQHLKRLYVQRGSGVAVTIKNARGKGAGHVVDFASRHSRNAAFDVTAALLDTDTDWNDKVRTMARKAKVQVLACEPCLEAVLLQVHDVRVHERTTAELKRMFAARFGSVASDEVVYAKHFSMLQVEAAHPRMPLLAELIRLLNGQG
ncbi:MAG: hypothetical protein RL392_247 [Pseudomonadota bacterium]|jgi:hypothetical protein